VSGAARLSGAKQRPGRGRPAAVPRAVLRAVSAAVLAAALLGTLGACGKKAGLRPPDGEAAAYTWPRAYPDPATVRPEKTAEKETETTRTPSREQAPAHASDITTFPEPPPGPPPSAP